MNTFAASNGTNVAPLVLSAVVIGLLFYFMIVRPQKRNLSRHKEMVQSLTVGDDVITSGGIYGTLVSVDDDSAVITIAPGTDIRVAKRSLAMKKVAPVEVETPSTPDEN